MNPVLERVGRALSISLTRERHVHVAATPTPPDRLLSYLEPADVLLVEGSSMISTAVKYLTQSTWSHAALYIGANGEAQRAGSAHRFIEADLVEGGGELALRYSPASLLEFVGRSAKVVQRRFSI
jgi:hypothetical protein